MLARALNLHLYWLVPPWPALLAYQQLRTIESMEATHQADYHTASLWPITLECAANDGY